MTEYLARFDDHQTIGLRAEFRIACSEVAARRGVTITDWHEAEPTLRHDVTLSVYAADIDDLPEPPCLGVVHALAHEQTQNRAMALGVAATGAGSPEDVRAYAASLPSKPQGSIRQVRATPTGADVRQAVVEWLDEAVSERAYMAAARPTLAADQNAVINANLARSTDVPANPWTTMEQP